MKSLSFWLAAAGLAVLTSCALNEPLKHTADLSGYKSFYVPAQSGDNLGLATEISNQLGTMGFTSSTGNAAKPTQAVNGIVSYRVDPMVNKTTHIQKLVVQIRDAKTGQLVAASRSDQAPSLMPSSNADMVALALRNILAATPVREGGGARGSLMERETLLW